MDEPDEEAFVRASAKRKEMEGKRLIFHRTISSPGDKRWLVSVVDRDSILAVGNHGTMFPAVAEHSTAADRELGHLVISTGALALGADEASLATLLAHGKVLLSSSIFV
jgi:hypothetical protein